MREITECTWSGYTASQSRVCHRTVHKGKSPYRGISCVAFTDGTNMSVDHRPALKREKVQEIHGYDSLLQKLAARRKTGYCSVMDVN